MIIVSFLKQCLSKSSVATSSFLISHPAPWSPLPPQAPRHAGRTQSPGCSGTGCSIPVTRLCHCLHSQGWSPLPQQQTWPKYPVFKERRLMLVGIGGQSIWGSPTKAKACTPERCCSPGCPEAKLLLTPLVSILLFPYLPTLRIPLLRILSYLFYCNYPAGQQQAPCPSLKNIHGMNNLRPLPEKEEEER